MILINEMSNCRIVDNLWHPKANEAVSLRRCVAACRNTKWHDGTLARLRVQLEYFKRQMQQYSENKQKIFLQKYFTFKKKLYICSVISIE